MERELIIKLRQNFEQAALQQDGIEFWCARDLQQLLEYTEWRNFIQVIEKAEAACYKAGQPISDHFVDVNKTIAMPKGASKEIEDVMLTRYACYLIAQNGDSRKESIAFAQSHFAVQTRKQEVLEERIRLVERLHARQKLIATETVLTHQGCPSRHLLKEYLE